jgi:hypothetical protein
MDRILRALTVAIVVVTVGHGPASAQLLPSFDDPRWAASNGVWEIGTPTSGPEQCYTNNGACAGTVLNGNYPPFGSTRLTSPPITLPTPGDGETVELRFWEWFSYDFSYVTDFGEVQVSVFDPEAGTYGDWTALPHKISIYSAVWSPVHVDLTAYAGKRVKLGFYHYAARDFAGRGGEGAGWYIDDLEIAAKAQTFTGDFETGWGDWWANQGVWEIGTPTAGPAACHSGTQCAGTVLAGNYPAYTYSRLVSAPISLPSVSPGDTLDVRFWHWFSYDTSYVVDQGQVQISVFDPQEGQFSEWTNIASPTSSASVVWSPVNVDVSPYAGKLVKLGFYHYAGRDFAGRGGESSGWYVDDICLVTPTGLRCFEGSGTTTTTTLSTTSTTTSTTTTSSTIPGTTTSTSSTTTSTSSTTIVSTTTSSSTTTTSTSIATTTTSTLNPCGPGVACDDGNPCTADRCTGAGQCAHDPMAEDATCDNGNTTTGDVCRAGVCTDATCDGTADGASCNDNNGCTDADVCQAGQCVPGTAPVCSVDLGGVCPPTASKCRIDAVCTPQKCRVEVVVRFEAPKRSRCRVVLRQVTNPLVASAELAGVGGPQAEGLGRKLGVAKGRVGADGQLTLMPKLNRIGRRLLARADSRTLQVRAQATVQVPRERKKRTQLLPRLIELVRGP